MVSPNAEFLMSTEEECLTATPRDPQSVPYAINDLFRILATLAPSLPGPSGYFNGYGRCYVDCEHLELAACEVNSPYLLPLIIERQHQLVAKARAEVQENGHHLLLANNNHSGLLQERCPVWGAHENYLVEQHPSTFTNLILPFLVTRFYGGSGGVTAPKGEFLAGVRPVCMTEVTGGGTTSGRAIHSTSRNEHHMGVTPKRFRYHGILGDGHRSQFNLAVQFGATALALKAIFFDRKLPGKLAQLGSMPVDNWIRTLQRLNVLQTFGGSLQIDPIIVRVQRVYLESARRYADRLRQMPQWVPDLLRDWDAMLCAAGRLDREWLSSHLDAFAKYEFYSSVLSDEGMSWRDLRRRPSVLSELALLDHSYHDFCDPESVFCLLDQQGLLEHRVGPPTSPGDEAEPFVPPCGTRAVARARFIKANAGQNHFVIDWSRIWDRKQNLVAALEDPFGATIGPWNARPQHSPRVLYSPEELMLLHGGPTQFVAGVDDDAF